MSYNHLPIGSIAFKKWEPTEFTNFDTFQKYKGEVYHVGISTITKTNQKDAFITPAHLKNAMGNCVVSAYGNLITGIVLSTLFAWGSYYIVTSALKRKTKNYSQKSEAVDPSVADKKSKLAAYKKIQIAAGVVLGVLAVLNIYTTIKNFSRITPLFPLQKAFDEAGPVGPEELIRVSSQILQNLLQIWNPVEIFGERAKAAFLVNHPSTGYLDFGHGLFVEAAPSLLASAVSVVKT